MEHRPEEYPFSMVNANGRRERLDQQARAASAVRAASFKRRRAEFREPDRRRSRRPSPMSKSRKKKRPPKRVLALPDLEQSKAAVLNTLTSKYGQRSYDRALTDFVDWYCSEPRLAFNRTLVLRHR